MIDWLTLNLVSFQEALNLLEILLLVTAFLTTISATIGQAITYYRWQCVLLAVVAAASALLKFLEQNKQATDITRLIIFIGLLPIILAVFIRPLLRRATLASDSKSSGDLRNDLKTLLAPILDWRLKLHGTSPESRRQTTALVENYNAQKMNAEVEWQHRQTIQDSPVNLLLVSLLLLLSFLIPYSIQIAEFKEAERIGLAVSLALHLVGLYNMIIKQDIISQVIGLLIMDHGLYLAVVKIVEVPVPAGFFVASLYLYTFITIFILFFLLPKVRATTESIDLRSIAENSDLRSEAGSES